MPEDQVKLTELIGEEKIRNRVHELGKKITEDYRGKQPVLIGALKGSFLFMADLCRTIELPLTIDFMEVSSYGNSMSSSGVVQILKDFTEDITGRDVILVEDIIDTGLTLNNVIEGIQKKKPGSMKIVSLLVKSDKHNLQWPIDYWGFEIEDRFVVGYGMDASGLYRNLPAIYIYSVEKK